VGSNPTPRAYLGYLYDNFKRNENTNGYRTTHLAHESILGFEEQEKKGTIYKKLYSITKSCSKPYFNKILIDLFNHNTENANAICDYLISEETEINIKNSTKEGRINILIRIIA
jgi:hypothetical protein